MRLRRMSDWSDNGDNEEGMQMLIELLVNQLDEFEPATLAELSYWSLTHPNDIRAVLNELERMGCVAYTKASPTSPREYRLT